MLCSGCSQKISPIVVCDIDGTLGDYHSHFTEFCRTYFGFTMPGMPWDGTGEFEEHLGLTKEQYRAAKLAYRQGGNKRWLPAYPGVSEMVFSVYAAGAEVWIATTRPWDRLDNIDPDTREWLRRNDIRYDGLLYGEDKYRQLLEHVDMDRVVAVIEDLPEQFGMAHGLGLPVIMRENFHNVHAKPIPRGRLDVCFNWALGRIKEWEEKYG